MHGSSFVRRGARRYVGAIALGLLVTPVVALAAPGNGATSGKTPIEFTFYDPCTGEFVDISGTIHGVSNVAAQNGGGSQVFFHQNFAGVTGVGESSGDVYTITGSATQRESVDSGVSRLSVHELFVSRGSGPNEAIGMQLEVTVGPGGEVTTVERSSDECRG